MLRNMRWVGVAAAAVVMLCAGMACAEVKPKVHKLDEVPKSVLFIGNSFFYYNNSMHNHVLKLVRADDPKEHYHAVSATISGSGLNWHNVESLFSTDGLGYAGATSRRGGGAL